MSKLLSFWGPLAINVKRQHFCATQFLMVHFGLGGHVRWEGRPIEERFPGCRNHPPLHTLPSTPVSQTPRITCFWTPKRVVFWNNLALKCPIFVTFLTSLEIDQKRTLLLKEFLVIFTFRIVFTRHSVAPDWQKVLFFKITIVLTASCQNHYRFDDLWSFMLSDNISVRLNF